MRYDVLILRAGRVQRVAPKLLQPPEARAWADRYNSLATPHSVTMAIALPHPLACAISRANFSLRSA